jgi:hypothetical protein
MNLITYFTVDTESDVRVVTILIASINLNAASSANATKTSPQQAMIKSQYFRLLQQIDYTITEQNSYHLYIIK